ncbi:anhydro-N-acetylmuramic acid kinase [Vibrio sp. UCD-FRSSP16_10]|uniref:anhydro-N-acetylmuramic acid kinase n=1 Tax=unclassified Vibrio TaxID=2614977 RepID=UPI0008000932|nr:MULTISPECIES: anhydro-N-acetylmuramic acid kinase [unclassified Vibrio]OBT07288.1 anhydro-N-acetylmuramic acid kinase [Vibrio sp. UCD-FRSSP16_30]OBT12768.1 anhydro-N-acetylmuramic acid kinase [Vibrio sp. UCD-FRSSP16_10]
MNKKELYIGIMSGTSLDGVDLALVRFENGKTHCLDTFEFPLPEQLKQHTLQVCQGQPTTLKQIGTLDHQFGLLYADAVNAFLSHRTLDASDITAIGCHGQTVYHQPTGDTPFTTQIGDANLIAIKTGITTVADFRRKDMALGGQGAPLVPAYHQTLFPTTQSCKVVLNIGGIANISVLKPCGEVLGYDTGPGNMLMDVWVQKHLGKPFDHDGLFAQKGVVCKPLLAHFMSDPYLLQLPPKSTGREHYNLAWLEEILSQVNLSISAQDVQATLLEFTATSIAEQCIHYQTSHDDQLLVCGGGANNPLLMQRLQSLLPQWHIGSTDSQGISGDYMEALAFAWLAYRRMHNLPSNLPKVTGACRATSLGVIYQAE